MRLLLRPLRMRESSLSSILSISKRRGGPTAANPRGTDYRLPPTEPKGNPLVGDT